ncbi:hypothetical protein [Companilactobacillus kimchiensis]|uniref:hypothetical protein n=1 Tax=Companilactobacillus kimchiensis TaxID=993692 RepID=UPI0012EEDA88|nr:hypothetical protein [Companilactobacillus kimchiensis]
MLNLKNKKILYVNLYEYLRKTGSTITHNQELLQKINAEFDYEQEVRKFFDK